MTTFYERNAQEAATADLGPNGELPVAAGDSLPFGLRPVGAIAAQVDATTPPGWLFRRTWPADAYGVLAAGHKVGKTWLMLDAAVAAATGCPWLGLFQTDNPGRVVIFVGEGGARKMTRRGRAVATYHGHNWDELPIHLAEAVPRLTDDHHVKMLRDVIARIEPSLVIIDPLYLAAGGADGRNLYSMGDVLGPAQRACQDAGAALMVAHHNNRDTKRSGSDRMSGAGPAEWGRVLVAVDRQSSRVDLGTERTDVQLALTIEGDEVAGGTYRLRRQIWADNPDDLASPIHYQLDPVEPDPTETGPTAGLSLSRRRVYAAVESASDWIDAQQIGDLLAEDGQGMPLKRRTILDAAAALVDAGLLAERDPGNGLAKSWQAKP